MKEIKTDYLLRIGLFSYFLIPYFILIKYYDFSFYFNYTELLWALKNSTVQSTFASFVVVGLSIVMSQGLFLLSDKIQLVLKKLLIIPQILPALYSVLIAFSLIHPFPMGTTGIVFLFILINLGFATLMTYSATEEKLANLALISEIYSFTAYRFYTQVYFPLMRSSLGVLFFTIFIFCMTSFSIPLLVGGGKGTNLEVLVYEKIFIEQNWPVAIGLCLFQSLMTFGLSFFMLNVKKNNSAVFNVGSYIKSYFGFFMILIYLALYIGGYVIGLLKSFSHIDFIFQYASEVMQATVFTTKALFFYLGLNILLLVLWLIDYLKNQRFNLAINLISVSTALVGFSFYLVFPTDKAFDIGKIILASSILFFPALFKLFLQSPIESLRSQVMISQIYGLPKSVVIIEIIFKQITRSLFLWLSFLIIWFISEYAILRALGVQTPTLGLLTQNFLSGYRLPMSYLISFYILVYWFLMTLVVYLISKVGYVIYKRFIY